MFRLRPLKFLVRREMSESGGNSCVTCGMILVGGV